MTDSNFSELHLAMRAEVDRHYLPGVSTALMRGREVVDRHCCGFADREAGTVLREDHIFRLFSNTKLVTSCAVMLLLEEGRIGLDDPIERYLPELGALRHCAPARPGPTTPSRPSRRSPFATR